MTVLLLRSAYTTHVHVAKIPTLKGQKFKCVTTTAAIGGIYSMQMTHTCREVPSLF